MTVGSPHSPKVKEKKDRQMDMIREAEKVGHDAGDWDVRKREVLL